MQRTIRRLAFAVAALAITTPSASAGQFKKPVYYHAGQLPRHVAAAQLTASGNVDLVFADYLSNQIVTLLGNGDGTFQKPIQFPAPSPISLAIGDFDEDGNQDLAVVETSAGDGSIAIFLGDGAGHFKLSASYQTGVAPSSVAVADFSGDGHLDLAVANNGGQSGKGSVTVLAGTGKGTFKKPVTYKIAGSPWGIAAGDLNGDHHPDLAVTNISGYVSVLLNDAAGKFLKPVTYNAGGGEVVDVKIADLRNEGKQDLVVANGSLSAVGVLLNKGGGSFERVKLYPTHCDVEAVVIADFNLDGHLDAAVAAQIDNSALLYGRATARSARPFLSRTKLAPTAAFLSPPATSTTTKPPTSPSPSKTRAKLRLC
jgi:FG-GAP-like repeat